jgi:hypothetical protein
MKIAQVSRMDRHGLWAVAVGALFSFVAGCSGGDPTGASGSDVGIRYGVDYSFSRPSPSGLHADGYTFAARYLSWAPNSKNLSAAEAKDLIANGVDVVSNWESSGTSCLSGYSQGVADATEAEKQAVADGMPAGRPIYFSVDFDAQAYQQTTINAYFDGVAAVIGRNRTGAYGGYYLIQRLFNDGKITYGWQTYAWSYGNWDSRAQVRQVQNDITAGGDGNCCDKDVAVAADFGQWGYNGGGGGTSGSPSREETGPSIARNADGRLEAFARGTDGALYHTWQTTAGGAWSGWAGLGGQLSSDPIASVNSDGRLEVFYRGTNGELYHLWQSSPGGGWSGHASLGGGLAQANVAIGHDADGRLEVFAVGTDDALWHIWQTTNGWSGWASLGGNVPSDIAVATNADGRLEVFYVGTSKEVYHLWQTAPNGGWSGHASLGGYVDPSVAVGKNGDGRLEIFVRGTDSKVYHAWQSSPGGAWSGWADLGGEITSDITVGHDQDGRLEIFARGTDNAMYHAWQDSSGWSGWAGLGGVITTDIGAAENADGRLEVFYRGTTAELYHLWQTTPNGGWSGHASLGGQIEP